MIETYLQIGVNVSGEYYHQQGAVSAGVPYCSVNGAMMFQFAADGQTLLETLPTALVYGQITIKDNSGQFFLENFSLMSGEGVNLILDKTDNLIFDFASGDRSFHTGINLWSGISGQLESYECQIFVNGVKLISGVNYTDIEWTDDLDITGNIFSIGNNFSEFLHYTGEYDIWGTRFQEFNSYLNGLKIHKDDFIKTATIVESIQTGIEPVFELNSTGIKTIISWR